MTKIVKELMRVHMRARGGEEFVGIYVGGILYNYVDLGEKVTKYLSNRLQN